MLEYHQREKYLEREGTKCPHCESNNIHGTSPQFEKMGLVCHVTCGDCGKKWKDVYTLTEVVG